jgi:hypothetical protein
MIQMAQNSLDRSTIELLLTENKFAEALALLSQRAHNAPLERESSLYILFVKVRLHGPEDYEPEIDALRRLTHFNDHEKALVRRIFLYAFQTAEKADEEEKQWAYQRLLRRLLLGQPLNQAIPLTPKALPARRVIHLDSGAIVPRPFQTKSEESLSGATTESSKKTARRFALGFCATCLLMTPISYFVLRVAPAPTHRSGATRAQSNPAPIAASADLLIHGMGTNTENETFEKFDEEQIKNSLTKQLSGLRGAYARWSAKKRNTMGSVSLKLTVDRKGKVVGVNDVDSHLSEAGFVPVVMAEARKWRFPVAGADWGEIIIPLLFVPKVVDARGVVARQQMFEPEANRPIKKSQTVGVSNRLSGSDLPAVGNDSPQLANAANDKPEESHSGYMAQQAVLLREEPRFASHIVEAIDQGTRIIVMEVQGDWFKVRMAHSSVAGFIRKEFVAPATFAR